LNPGAARKADKAGHPAQPAHTHGLTDDSVPMSTKMFSKADFIGGFQEGRIHKRGQISKGHRTPDSCFGVIPQEFSPFLGAGVRACSL